MTDKKFTCRVCQQRRDFSHLAEACNEGIVCTQCCHEDNPVDRLSDHQIRHYFSLDMQLDEYLSFGQFYSEKEGGYIEYMSLWGQRITDPRVISLIKQKHEILFPDQYSERDGESASH